MGKIVAAILGFAAADSESLEQPHNHAGARASKSMIMAFRKTSPPAKRRLAI
jgi:hypothetical protein